VKIDSIIYLLTYLQIDLLTYQNCNFGILIVGVAGAET